MIEILKMLNLWFTIINLFLITLLLVKQMRFFKTVREKLEYIRGEYLNLSKRLGKLENGIKTSKNMYTDVVKEMSDIDVYANIDQCPNCGAGILDNGKCSNNYTYCKIRLKELKEAIEIEKIKRNGNNNEK